jgi:hypothetical protein
MSSLASFYIVPSLTTYAISILDMSYSYIHLVMQPNGSFSTQPILHLEVPGSTRGLVYSFHCGSFGKG